MVKIEQLIKYTVLIEAGTLTVTVIRNFPVKGFIKKGLNSRLVKHINKSMENVHLYVRVSTYIISTVSWSARMVKTAAITVTSNGAFKALKASLTIFINQGGA